jgi:hypothetical protein
MVLSDETSSSPSCNSTSTPRKTASGNSCKSLREIQQSDQKLWPFRTGTPSLERRDILLTEGRFHIFSKENSVRKLL